MFQIIVILILSIFMIIQSLSITGIISDTVYINILEGKNVYVDLVSGLASMWGIIFGILGIIFTCLYIYLVKKCDETHDSTRLKMFISYIILSIIILV